MNLRDLRREELPPGFSDRVMSQIATRPSPHPSLWRRLLRSRSMTIQLSPARAVTFAFGVLIAAILIERPPRHLPALPRQLEVGAPVLIRFSVTAPDARTVSLTGDFNGWRADAAPAERGPDGVWRITLPIRPGRWSYSFVIDGKFVEDPLAEAFREDGFGGRNAVIRVD